MMLSGDGEVAKHEASCLGSEGTSIRLAAAETLGCIARIAEDNLIRVWIRF